jgi:hypothetical protein
MQILCHFSSVFILLIPNFYIVLFHEVGDNLGRKELGFGRNTLRAEVIGVRVEPGAEGYLCKRTFMVCPVGTTLNNLLTSVLTEIKSVVS